MDQKNNYKSVWYFLVLFIVFYGFSITLYACPAYDGLFELKQPSGKSFEVRQRGDEYYNWVETKDGYGIYKNATTGKWEYYTPSIDAKDKGQMVLPSTSHAVVGEADPASLGIPRGLRPLKKEASPAAELRSLQKKGLNKKLASTSATGTKYLLVIGVDYADAPATYTAEQIQPLLFGASSSVSHYYSKTSYSAVTISPASESQGTSNDGFIGWLRLSGNHPNTGSAGWNSTANKQIAKDAILAADSYIDFSSYDTDGDGVVEPTELSIIIIVAGYEASYGGSSSPSVWAHYSGMSAVGSPTVDGKTIYQYAEFGEKHGDHLSTFGVMAHELGHLMFSLPDLYDTDTSNGDSEGVGYFDLMGTGSWGSAYGAYAGSSPTHLSAWSKEYLSWGTVNSISTSQSVSFSKVDGNSSSIFRINTSDSNQYFLIENRQFAGYDIGFQNYTGASGHGGLVIYHIDTLKTSLWPNTSNNVNADENDKGVDVEEANEGSLGYSMLDTNKSRAETNMFFFSGNNSSFTNYTIPSSKLKNENPTNISIVDISTYGDVMTATISLSADITSPNASISINNGDSYTNTTTVTLNLTASDNIGVTGYYLSTNSTTPSASDSSWTTITSTTSYSETVLYSLSSGEGSKTIYVWYKDGSGNVSSVASDSIVLDTTAPTITITSPTPSSTYTTTSSTTSLSGSVSDSGSGISRVTWRNNRGGSGNASGTTSWSISDINLSNGENVITVTATDGAGNTGTDTITATYTSTSPTPMVTTTPTPLPIPTSTSSCADSFEPNDSFSTAYGPLVSHSNYQGKICSPSDVDYFKIHIANPGLISLTLNIPLDKDYDLYLYDSRQSFVSFSTMGLGIPETIGYFANTTGTYYVQVIGYFGSFDENQTYTLSGIWEETANATPTAIPTQIPEPTPPPLATPVSTTPSGICEAESMEISTNRLVLKKRQSGEITVSVKGADDCPVEGITVTANVSSKRISVSPVLQATDDGGEAVFTITAKNKPGKTRVTFSFAHLKTLLTVKVSK